MLATVGLNFARSDSDCRHLPPVHLHGGGAAQDILEDGNICDAATPFAGDAVYVNFLVARLSTMMIRCVLCCFEMF